MEKKGRRLIVLRHAERVDNFFKQGHWSDWLAKAFDGDGQYSPFHWNMPDFLPNRKDAPEGWRDGPITKTGYSQSVKIGKDLLEARLGANYVYTSPALRSIQTAAGLCEGMGHDKVTFQVEPALFEWMHWYQNDGIPKWMANQDLYDHGYPINLNYQPMMKREELLHTETIHDFYQRCHQAVKRILDSHPEDCTIMIVGHKASVETCTRYLVAGENSRSEEEFWRVFCSPPVDAYLMYLQADEKIDENNEDSDSNPKSSWQLVQPPKKVDEWLKHIGMDWTVFV